MTPAEKLDRKRRAYRQLFLADDGGANEPAKVVMADLARFCNATKPSVRVSPQTGAIDPMAMAVGEGRREVYLRIQSHLGLTDADVRAIARETDDG